MKKARLSLPQLAVVAGTRGMLGAGAGLLMSGKLKRQRRKSIGWTLLVTGIISTIPLALKILRKRKRWF
jgi:hypothetical protein